MSTEVAAKPSGEELNKQLKAAMRTIDRKLKALGHLSMDDKPLSYKTNGSFKMNENDGNNVNIFTYTDACYLGKALAKMKRVKKEYSEAMEGLGLKTYPVCVWYGHTVDYWIHDLEIRTRQQVNQSTIAELLKSKQELSQFLSQEDKLEATLSKLSGLLKT